MVTAQEVIFKWRTNKGRTFLFDLDMTKKEALEVIRKNILSDKNSLVFDALQTIVPELSESEDERIRKFIIECIEELQSAYTEYAEFNGRCSDAIAWLEKQGDKNTIKEGIISSLRSYLKKDWDISENHRLVDEINECFGKHFILPFTGKDIITVSDLMRCIAHFYEFGKKEQKPLSTEETELNSTAFLEQLGYTCIPPNKEQKPFPTLGLTPIIKNGDTIGVNIPIINKSLIFDDISKDEMGWDEAVAYAKDLDKALPTKNELYILQYFREDIVKLYPRFADLSIWSDTQYLTNSAWRVSYLGFVYNTVKDKGFTAVPLADLQTSSLDQSPDGNGESRILEQKPADKIIVRPFNEVFSQAQIDEIDKCIEEKQKKYNAQLRDAMRKVEDFPMTD